MLCVTQHGSGSVYVYLHGDMGIWFCLSPEFVAPLRFGDKRAECRSFKVSKFYRRFTVHIYKGRTRAHTHDRELIRECGFESSLSKGSSLEYI